jgi:putative flavoprotein involved in K+ transport
MADALEHYAAAIKAPIRPGVRAVSLRYADRGYQVLAEEAAGATPAEFWAASVVAATGAYQRPHVPAGSGRAGPGITVLASDAYRGPAQLPPGAVLVIGSGQSGVQIADDLIRAGRRVFLSVGRCGWVPRRYRGRDIACWLVEMGLLERTVGSLPSPAARLACFPQVSGARGGCDLNVHTLAAEGAVLLGRVTGVREGRVRIADDLPASLAAADSFAAGIRRAIDEHAQGSACPAGRPTAGRCRPRHGCFPEASWTCGRRGSPA